MLLVVQMLSTHPTSAQGTKDDKVELGLPQLKWCVIPVLPFPVGGLHLGQQIMDKDIQKACMNGIFTGVVSLSC